jgi:YceI-like domain
MFKVLCRCTLGVLCGMGLLAFPVWGSEWKMRSSSEGDIKIKAFGTWQSAEIRSHEKQLAVTGKISLEEEPDFLVKDCEAVIDAKLVRSSTSRFLDGIIQRILDTPNHTTLTFRCQKYLPVAEKNHFKMEGDLVIKKIKKTQIVEGEFKPNFPTKTDEETTLVLKTEITRQDYEVQLEDARDTVLGNAVGITLTIRLVRDQGASSSQ